MSVLLGNGDGTFAGAGQFATDPQATPLVADVTGDGTDDVLVVDGAGESSIARASPASPAPSSRPSRSTPAGSIPTSRDIAWLPNTDQGPVLASVDAQNNAISLYAYRDGGFVRLSGSLATGQLPAQIIAADLNGNGMTDLVVRNAGDGTLSVYFGTPFIPGSFSGPVDPELAPPDFLPPVTLSVGLGVSDVQAVDTTGDGRLDLVVTNELTGQVSVLLQPGQWHASQPRCPIVPARDYPRSIPAARPRSPAWRRRRAWLPGPLTPGGPTGLVTINPGSNTLDVLAGLGGGRFANPVTIETASPAQIVRMADFTGNGIDDLAVLTADGLEHLPRQWPGGLSAADHLRRAAAKPTG